jgi:hypothetical protein
MKKKIAIALSTVAALGIGVTVPMLLVNKGNIQQKQNDLVINEVYDIHVSNQKLIASIDLEGVSKEKGLIGYQVFEEGQLINSGEIETVGEDIIDYDFGIKAKDDSLYTINVFGIDNVAGNHSDDSTINKAFIKGDCDITYLNYDEFSITPDGSFENGTGSQEATKFKVNVRDHTTTPNDTVYQYSDYVPISE